MVAVVVITRVYCLFNEAVSNWNGLSSDSKNCLVNNELKKFVKGGCGIIVDVVSLYIATNWRNARQPVSERD